MSRRVIGLAVVFACAMAPAGAFAQTFDIDLGSDGSDGALNVTADTVLPLPPDGTFHYTSVNVAAGARLSFSFPGSFHPGVVFLVQGDAVIDGVIDVSGQDAGSTPTMPGPGGTAGGPPATMQDLIVGPRLVPTFGSPELLPPGGGGGLGEHPLRASITCADAETYGGAGGGSFVLVANGTIRGSGEIDASGGAGATPFNTNCREAARRGGDGSVHLEASRVDAASLELNTGSNGVGRVRAFLLDGPPTVSGTLRVSTSVRRWRAPPTSEIIAIDGMPFSDGEVYTPPVGTSLVAVSVRVTGCGGGSRATAYVSTSPFLHRNSASEDSPADDTTIVVPARISDGHFYRLAAGARCDY